MTDPSNGNTLAYRVAELEKDVEGLLRKVDRLMWSLVSLTIALTTTTVMLLITRIVEQNP